MATIALATVGNIIAPGVGGFIGAAVGGAIDNFLIFPAVFPKPALSGARAGDKSIQLASEGSDAKWIIGPRNRQAGTVIYLSDIIEEPDTLDGGKKGNDVTLYKAFVDLAVAVCETSGLPNNRVFKIKRIWADSKVIYQNGALSKCSSVSVYLGDQTAPDPLLEARLGVGNVPNYRNTAYVVIEKLALEDFGNRLPNLTFEVSQDETLNVDGALALMAERAGLEPTEYDVSNVSACFGGYTISGPQSGADFLPTVLQAYAVTVSEDAGKVVFVSRGLERTIVVPEADMAARESGTAPDARLFERTDTNDWVMPREVVVKFLSDDNDLQQGAEREVRNELVSDNVVTMDLALTMSPSEARAIARRTLYAAEAERVAVKFNLPPSYVHLKDGTTLISAETGDEYFISEVTRGANYMVVATGVRTSRDAYSQSGVSQPSGTVPNTLPNRPLLTLVMVDGPALLDSLTETAGLYFATCATDPTERFDRGALYRSATNDGTYAFAKNLTVEATIGRVLEPPHNNEAINTGYWDTESSIEVELLNGDLESVTEQECLDGANRAFLVSEDGLAELIGFATVTPIVDNRVAVSKLLRGLKGSPLVAGPVMFVRVSSAVGFSAGADLAGAASYWKAGSNGRSLTTIQSVRALSTDANRRPLAPTHLRARRGPDDSVSFGSVTSASADNSVTRSGGFGTLTAGDWVTLGNAADPSRNVSWLVVSRPEEEKLILENAAVSLTDESNLTLCPGHVDDVRVSWSRRGKRESSVFAASPLSADESPLGFVVEVRTGGTLAAPRRTAEVQSQSWVYSSDMRAADGTSSFDRLFITVAQKSTTTTRGYESSTEIFL